MANVDHAVSSFKQRHDQLQMFQDDGSFPKGSSKVRKMGLTSFNQENWVSEVKIVAHSSGADYSPEVEGSHSLLICGDAAGVLDSLPPQCVQSVVTSPPYWSLRDYGIEGQIGSETTVEEFIKALTLVFDSVRRVLRDDGTLWLNIGDSYTSGGRTWRAPDRKNSARAMQVRPPTPNGLKPKDLIGVPWRLALALQASGWYLRADIVWNKPNCQPESVNDRPTRSHEYVFLFSKSERYYYDVKAVKGPNGRRLRSVWDIKTKAYPEAKGHFATYPPKLVEPCILCGSRANDLILDPFLGSGTSAIVAAGLNRRILGIELHPKYLQLAEKRLKKAGVRVVDTRTPTEARS